VDAHLRGFLHDVGNRRLGVDEKVVDRLLDVARGLHVKGEVALGIEIDEAAVRAADARGHVWRTPVWRHPDGALAEW